MKYIISFVSFLAITLIFVFSGFNNCKIENMEYLRIHIRANSNLAEDQRVKYMVKDAIVEALIPILSQVDTIDEAKTTMKQNFNYIENIANNVLKAEKFEYKSSAYLSNEFFPARTYENLTLESGYYDALILNLGEGSGDNWWCVVYPAFCFLETKNSSNYGYISKIWEIINSVTKN